MDLRMFGILIAIAAIVYASIITPELVKLQNELTACDKAKISISQSLAQTTSDYNKCLIEKQIIEQKLSDCKNQSTKWEKLYTECEINRTKIEEDIGNCTAKLEFKILLTSIAKNGATLLSIIVFIISLVKDIFEADFYLLTKRQIRFILIFLLMILTIGATVLGW